MHNTSFIDQKYIHFLSSQLRNFRTKGNGVYEFTHSCEKAESRKRRGYFYPKGNGYNFYCHNCGESTKFFSFLKRQSPQLFNEYRLEVFTGSTQHTKPPPIETPTTKDQIKIPVPIEGLELFSGLSENHPAVQYLKKRKIPQKFYDDLYFCKRFNEWGSSIAPNLQKMQTEEPRLVIPYRDKSGELFGFTCRSFDPASKRKYIELKLSDEEMIYGQDRLDPNKRILCVEGPIDSMFLPNCVAVGGASYRSEFLNKYKHKVTIVPDNDWKRNKQVCDSLVKAAESGFSIALFPDGYKHKDINKAIIEGMSSEEIIKLIKDNTKSGQDLILDIAFRRKC